MIRAMGKEIWQKRWEDDQKGRKYHNIQKSVITKIFKERNRREEIIMTRLRVGHTGLNDTINLIGKKNTDKCERCGVKENVEHILMQCLKYSSERERGYRGRSEQHSRTGVWLEFWDLKEKEKISKL